MFLTDPEKGRGVPAPDGLSRHTRSVAQVYPEIAPETSQKPENSLPQSLSPTRPPTVRKDASLWPSWTDKPIEKLGLVLLSEQGHPIIGRRV